MVSGTLRGAFPALKFHTRRDARGRPARDKVRRGSGALESTAGRRKSGASASAPRGVYSPRLVRCSSDVGGSAPNRYPDRLSSRLTGRDTAGNIGQGNCSPGRTLPKTAVAGPSGEPRAAPPTPPTKRRSRRGPPAESGCAALDLPSRGEVAPALPYRRKLTSTTPPSASSRRGCPAWWGLPEQDEAHQGGGRGDGEHEVDGARGGHAGEHDRPGRVGEEARDEAEIEGRQEAVGEAVAVCASADGRPGARQSAPSTMFQAETASGWWRAKSGFLDDGGGSCAEGGGRG
jgi:hypothetical protein